MIVTSKIRLDMAKPGNTNTVYVVQGDGNTRAVEAELLANGSSWTPDGGWEAAITYRKPDGTKGLYNLLDDGSSAITISGSKATVILAQQIMTVPGTVRAAIVFNNQRLDQLTSFPFLVSVARNQFSGAQQSDDYIRLQWLEDKLDDYLRKAADSGAFRGEKGDQGPQGEQGVQGPQGPQGEPGVSTIVNGKAPDEAGNVTLSAADVGALPVSGGDMTGAINMNGQSISGLNDPTEESQAARKGYVDAAKTAANAYTDTAVRKAAPRNLLDNSDFRNPVNQRGQTSYSNNFIYTIDRWQTGDNGTTIQLQSDGVELHSSDGSLYPYIFQRVEKMCAGTYTFAAKFHGNTGIVALTSYATENLGYIVPTSADENGVIILSFTITEEIDSSFAYFRVQLASAESSVVWDWAALYEGEYTAETLPEYQPKGYGAELAECKRYAEVINTGVSQFCHSYNDTVSAFSVEYAEKRIKNPTITMLGSLTRAVIVPGVGILDPTSIEFVYPIGAKSMRMNVFGTFDTSKVYAVDYNAVKLFISADL